MNFMRTALLLAAMTGLFLAVGYLLVVFEESREAERRAMQVQVFARDAELRSLRAQLDPHFLFNCLHSISALTTADPPAARRMCLLLAEFLRETLALGSESPLQFNSRLAKLIVGPAQLRGAFGDALLERLIRLRRRFLRSLPIGHIADDRHP